MTSRALTRRALCLALASAVVGCATVPPAAPERSYVGRFAATATRGTERESTSGRFSFEVRGERHTLDLATPLGSTLARIEAGPDGARASGAQVGEITGSSPDELAERLLGWPLPVAGLSDWIDGRPAPGRPARIERDGTRIASFDQDGWSIEVPAVEAGTPRRLVFRRAATAFAPAVEVRLVVDEVVGGS